MEVEKIKKMPTDTNFDFSDNEKIISLIRQGDEVCFDAIYRHYYKSLCAFSSRFVNIDDAEEIVQDTMLWLYENHETLINGMSLKGLLFMIVKNKSLNKVTHSKITSRIHQQISEKLDEQFDNPDFYLENELMQMFNDAMAKMPEELKEVFMLSRVRDMTHKQIAEHLGISSATVNYRIGQTMKFLRHELKDYLPILLFLLK